MSDVLHQLDVEIARCRKQISSTSTKLELANQRDPYGDKRQIIFELSGLQTRLANLKMERRSQTPVGESDERSPGAGTYSFIGSNS